MILLEEIREQFEKIDDKETFTGEELKQTLRALIDICYSEIHRVKTLERIRSYVKERKNE